MNRNDKERLRKLLILENRLRMPAILKPFIQTDKRYNFAYGGRGGGKSESYARILLDIASKEKVRILCTREIQISIKDSVYSLLTDLINELEYEGFDVSNNRIVHENGSEFLFMGLYLQDRKQTMKSLANIDYCWVEEAQTISQKSLELLDPTIRKENSKIFFSFNRLLPEDPIYIFMNQLPEKEKLVIQVNYYDNEYLPNVLLDQALRAKSNYENKIDDSYLHVWLGNPQSFSEKTIIRLQSVIDAMNRTVKGDGACEIGADIARYGKDRTVFFKRKGMKLLEYRIYNKLSVMETARYLIDFVGKHKTDIQIKIDDSGLGGGVTDYLMENGYNVTPINFGGRANDPDKYSNIISEMWFTFAQNIDKIELLDIQELKNELVSREWKIDLKGRRSVESKDDYKKRGYRSPDLADACLLCYYEDVGQTNYFGRSIM